VDKRHNAEYLHFSPLLKMNEPGLFREFMVTHWIYASLVELTGCILYLRSKKQDALKAMFVSRRISRWQITERPERHQSPSNRPLGC
jgi:hypothetical protein